MLEGSASLGSNEELLVPDELPTGLLSTPTQRNSHVAAGGPATPNRLQVLDNKPESTVYAEPPPGVLTFQQTHPLVFNADETRAFMEAAVTVHHSSILRSQPHGLLLGPKSGVTILRYQFYSSVVLWVEHLLQNIGSLSVGKNSEKANAASQLPVVVGDGSDGTHAAVDKAIAYVHGVLEVQGAPYILEQIDKYLFTQCGMPRPAPVYAKDGKIENAGDKVSVEGVIYLCYLYFVSSICTMGWSQIFAFVHGLGSNFQSALVHEFIAQDILPTITANHRTGVYTGGFGLAGAHVEDSLMHFSNVNVWVQMDASGLSAHQRSLLDVMFRLFSHKVRSEASRAGSAVAATCALMAMHFCLHAGMDFCI